MYGAPLCRTIAREIESNCVGHPPALVGLDHSSDKNDVMYGQYDAQKQSDPQLSNDQQQMLQDHFNKPADKNEATVTDEDAKKEPPKKDEPKKD